MDKDNLNSVSQINPNLDKEIESLQSKLDKQLPMGTLFGAFVLIKDNVDLSGMSNSAGSWLMRGHFPRQDAFFIQQLKKQDALILGKTNLSEWANFRSTKSSSGWSSLFGQTRNPYNKDYSPCGSSSGSGVAVAADLALFAVGTETDGSVTCPAAINGIVGIKPSIGLVSRSGIIPISHSQDTAGPMARTVKDAVYLLEAMMGKDSNDHSSSKAIKLHHVLKMGGLKGKRIGVVNNAMGYHEQMDAIFNKQLEVLKGAGAIIKRLEVPTLDEVGDDEYTVLLAEFKHDLNRYLKASSSPLSSLQDAIHQNNYHKQITMPIFDQDIFIASLNAPSLKEDAYLKARETSLDKAGKSGIDKALKTHNLDLLIAPTTGPAWKIDHKNGDTFLGAVSSGPAIAGYPHVTVPMGYVSGLPVGMSFIGSYMQDALVIQAAYEYEQLSKVRIPPVLK